MTKAHTSIESKIQTLLLGFLGRTFLGLFWGCLGLSTLGLWRNYHSRGLTFRRSLALRTCRLPRSSRALRKQGPVIRDASFTSWADTYLLGVTMEVRF